MPGAAYHGVMETSLNALLVIRATILAADATDRLARILSTANYVDEQLLSARDARR